jgi:hypothetical protein
MSMFKHWLGPANTSFACTGETQWSNLPTPSGRDRGQEIKECVTLQASWVGGPGQGYFLFNENWKDVWQCLADLHISPWKLQVGEKKVALLRIMLKIVWEQRWRERRVRLSDGFPNSLWSQAVEDSHPRENFAAERRAEIQLAQIENSGFGGPGALGPSMAWRMD